jgi:protein-S-isoprenylcysteine O-methyltransferase Ste14
MEFARLIEITGDEPAFETGLLLAVAVTFFLVVTAKIEEAENNRFFGPAYQA